LKKEIAKAREHFEKNLLNYFSFVKEIPFLFISAKNGFETKLIYKTVNEIMESYEKRISTSEINQFLENILKKFPPPLHRKKPVRINYATQGGTKPPTFIFFTNFKEGVTRSYQKFLENSLRESFGFKGTPIKLLIKQKKNIYKKD
jgi:GTP-binding protein